MRINILLNRQEDWVQTVPLALGESEGSITLHLPEAMASNQGMASKYAFEGAGQRLEVAQVSLDTWLAENAIARVDLIKMDIQGAELDLLRGAQHCLRNMRPVLYLEADAVQSGNAHQSLADLYQAIVARDYRVSMVSRKKRIPMDGNNLTSGNWLGAPA